MIDKDDDTRIYPAYDVMVARLFKQVQGPYSSLMHAAIGIAGEAAEMLHIDNYKNLMEESGDMEFYVEAIKQHFIPNFSKLSSDQRQQNITVSNVFINITSLGGDILDIVKKSWVYGKELDSALLTTLVLTLECNLVALYQIFGTDKTRVQHHNQIKLVGPGGRYESGFYTDEAAIARADKIDSTGGRKFIGQPGIETKFTFPK